MKGKTKVSEPPPMAQTIFSVVNLLPPGLMSDSCSSVYEKLCDEDSDGRIAAFKTKFKTEPVAMPTGLYKSGNSGGYDLESLLTYGFYRLKALELCLAGMPDDFVRYVALPKTDLQSVFEFATQVQFKGSYQSFLEANACNPGFADSFLFGLATKYAWIRYDKALSWYTRLYDLANFIKSHVDQTRRVQPFIDESKVFRINSLAVRNGRIGIEPDEFTLAFLGIGTERIKLCDNCGRVFWASRNDMKGCTRSCAKILRTRKWREKVTPEQRLKYKINRLRKDEDKGE